MRVRTTVTTVAAAVVLLAGCDAGSVFALEVGDCFDDDLAAGEEIDSVPIRPCEEPHDNEVYALYDLAGEEFPGDAALEEDALDGCYDRFEAYVGTAWEESALDFFPILPTEEGWNEGDRGVICALYDVELAKLTGSMQGSAR